MADKILVTGYIRFDPAKLEAFTAAAASVMEASQAEDGVERYTYSADLVEPGLIHVYEQYAHQGAMDAHMASPHLAEFMGAAGSLGITAASLTKWDGASPSKLM